MLACFIPAYINSSKASHVWLNPVDVLGYVNRLCVYSSESGPKSLPKVSLSLTRRKSSNSPFPGFTIHKTDNLESSLGFMHTKKDWEEKKILLLSSCDFFKGFSKTEWEKVICTSNFIIVIIVLWVFLNRLPRWQKYSKN